MSPAPAALIRDLSDKTGTRRLLLLAIALLFVAQTLPMFHSRWVEDESWYSVSADSLVQHGRLQMPVFAPPAAQSIVDTRPPLAALTLASSFKLLGTSLVAARLPFLLAAIAGIFLTYALGCELGGVPLGLLGAILLATENMYFIAARTARPEALVTALDVLGILLFVRSQRRNSTLLAGVSGLVIGLATVSHPNGFAAAIGAGLLAIVEFRGKVAFRARSWAFVAGVLLAIAPYVAWGFSDAAHKAEMVGLYAKGQGFPLSAIGSIEKSRWADFIGVPNGRFKLPIPLPYRLHIAIALVLAAITVFRYNRRLAGQLACLLTACVVWWAFLRHPTARYIACGAPYLSLLLGGAILALREHRPQWRKPVAAAAVFLIVSQLGGNLFLLYLYRTANYARVTSELRTLIPRDATVWGAMTFWMSLHDQKFYSWNRTPLPYALAHGATYLILNDRVMVNGSGFGSDDWQGVREQAEAFVAQHATLVGHAPNAFYGDLEIYRVDR